MTSADASFDRGRTCNAMAPKAAAVAVPLATAGFVGSVNAPHYLEVQAALDEICAHPKFVGIKDAQPLSVSAGGAMEPFKLDKVRQSLMTGT